MFDVLQHPANLIMLKAISRLFLISGIGYLAVRLHLLSSRAVECLSTFVIVIALPCLVISTLSRELDYDLLPEMGLCLVAALLLNCLGLAAALGVRRLFIPASQPGRRMFLSLAAIQNSGYLPIPLTNAILPEGQRSAGLLFLFVYLLVMGFIFWSLGIRLIGRVETSGGVAANLRKAVNPPIVGLLIGLLFLIPPVKEGFNSLPFMQEGLTTVGGTTVPLVLIILGGSFASITAAKSGRLVVNLAAAMKLIFVPVVALTVAVLLKVEQVFAFALILQAAMPAAMNHIVVAHEYGGDTGLTSRALFVQYLFSLITVPFFLLMYNWIYL